MTRMAKEGNHHNGADELLCEAAIAVDRALEEMDRKIDWLERLTPVNIDEIWDGFQASSAAEHAGQGSGGGRQKARQAK